MINCFYQTVSRWRKDSATLKKGSEAGWRYFNPLLLLILLGYSGSLFAQSQIVTGRVKTQSGSLPGVSVLVKGTSTGTTTDADGVFSLTVPDAKNNVLVFSFIGYVTQEMAVNNRTEYNIDLEEDITQLSEVVVTALGVSQEKKGLGYSVQQVTGADIAQTQRPNFLTSLQGRVAGLSLTSTSGLPGSSTSITLRGVSSISGNNQPLIVVDGLPVENRVFNQHNLVSNQDNRNNDYINRAADINPNDIESVTILKGPEAAALYGQEGASGAIIITTKKGAKGPARITYDNNFGFQKVYRFPETQNKYMPGNFGYDDPLVDELTFFGPRYAEGTTFYDNTDAFFQTGHSQTHNLTFETGSDNSTFRFATNYFDQSGVVPNNSYEKFSTRLTASTKLFSKGEITTTLNYITSTNLKPLRGANGYMLGVLAWPAHEDITSYLNPDGTRRRILVSNPSSSNYNLEPNNPLFLVNKMKNSDKTERVLANTSITYDPLSWLNVTGRLGADIYSTLGNTFLHPEASGVITLGGSVENYSENNRLLNGQFLLTGKKELGKFKGILMLGSSFDDKNYETNSIYGERLLLKEFNSINNTTLNTRNAKTVLTRKRLVSTFGSMTLNYSDLIYLNFTGRNDWSSTMPIDNRSYFYPSVSASFVFTELNALSSNTILSFGKLRASYAEVGKDAPTYSVRSSLTSRTSTGGGFAYDFFGGNPKLKPERAKGYEIGTELKLFNGKFGLDVAWYKNDRLDQISTQRLSYGTGFVLSLLNGGSISVQGLEVQLSATPLERNGLQWNVFVNFSRSKSEVIELPAQVKEFYNSDTWLYAGARGSAFPENLSTFYNPTNYPYYNWDYMQRGMGSATAIGGVTYERNVNGDIMINPATGLPYKTADYLPLGDRNPDFMIGLTNSVTYRNLSLSFLLDFRKGGDVFNANELYLFRVGLSKQQLDRETPVIFNGVLKDGLENTDSPTRNTIEVNPYTMGSTYYAAYAESDFIERDINWLRLRDITLSYGLPSKLLGSQKIIRSVGIFTTMTDLFMITNYTGADPMVNGTNPATNGAGAFGFDYGSLSTPRSITFGVRLSL